MDELLLSTRLSHQNIELLTADGRSLTLNDLNALEGSDLIINVVGLESDTILPDNGDTSSLQSNYLEL